MQEIRRDDKELLDFLVAYQNGSPRLARMSGRHRRAYKYALKIGLVHDSPSKGLPELRRKSQMLASDMKNSLSGLNDSFETLDHVKPELIVKLRRTTSFRLQRAASLVAESISFLG